MKQKIILSKKIPEECLAPYRDRFEFLMPETDEAFSDAFILQELASCDGYFDIDMVADRAVIDRGRSGKLKAIANFGVGYDRIDWKYATEVGMPILNTPTQVTEATAEHTVALLMATMRGIPRYDKEVRRRVWESPLFSDRNTLIAGAVLGIVGFGRIGRRVCRKAQGLGMQVVYFDQYRAAPEVEAEFGVSYLPFEELLRTSDCITLHCPYFPENFHMFGRETFEKMKPSAYFINAARGKLVDEIALCEALRNGIIKGAGLDVFEEEPNGVYEGLLALDNVVLTPHIASLTMRSRVAMANEGLGGLITILEGGTPKNVVNPSVLSKE